MIKDFLINRQIREKEIRVISATGEALGIMPTTQAQGMADDMSLDLVMISPTAIPPVCRIMDYGKYKYEQGKKEKENRKNQKTVELKEIKLSPTIDIGDIQIKARQSLSFLHDGNKVKVSIRMRGRQQSRPETSLKIMNAFLDIIKDDCIKEIEPKQEGQSIYMILAPNKK